MRDRRQKQWTAAFLLACGGALAIVFAVLTAPAAQLHHLLQTQTPSEICADAGQPSGFYPPGETPPAAEGRVAFDPYSVHCLYADWLGGGPVETVARGWPLAMAAVAGAALVGVAICAMTGARLLVSVRSRSSP